MTIHLDINSIMSIILLTFALITVTYLIGVEHGKRITTRDHKETW